MKIFKNNKKLIIGLVIFVSSCIVQKISILYTIALICDPAPYCRHPLYSHFPNFTVVFVELLSWSIRIGGIILVWALGEKIINWIKKKKDKNK